MAAADPERNGGARGGAGLVLMAAVGPVCNGGSGGGAWAAVDGDRRPCTQ